MSNVNPLATPETTDPPTVDPAPETTQAQDGTVVSSTVTASSDTVLPNQLAGSPVVSRITKETIGTGSPLIPSSTPSPSHSDSRWLQNVDDDNALDTNNSAYVGVSPEYMNHADDTTAPFFSEEPLVRESEEEASEVADALAMPVSATNPAQTYDPGTPHPSERTKPQDRYIEGNRALMDRAIEDS